MHLPADSDSRAAAAAVGGALAPARWPERVRAWAETEARADEPWCVALSGGADSVAVLLALCGLRNAECALPPEESSRLRNVETGRRIERGAVLQPAPADMAESQERGLKHRVTADAEPGRARALLALHFNHEIGRASCRERVSVVV